MTDAPETPAAPPLPAAAPSAETGRDRALLVVFWAWAGILVVATLAQLFQWKGVLEALDVKRWFAR